MTARTSDVPPVVTARSAIRARSVAAAASRAGGAGGNGVGERSRRNSAPTPAPAPTTTARPPASSQRRETPAGGGSVTGCAACLGPAAGAGAAEGAGAAAGSVAGSGPGPDPGPGCGRGGVGSSIAISLAEWIRSLLTTARETRGATMPPATASASAAQAREHLLELLGPIVADAGYDLEDVTVTSAGRRGLVRVTVGADAAIGPDAVSLFSRLVSDALDADGNRPDSPPA